ncbi:MAG: ribokinase [bacterium]
MDEKIAVIGSNMMDLITYMDRIPAPGETLETDKFDLGFGGKGANQATAAARLGAEVTFVSRVGDDLFGPEVINNMKSMGINTSHVKTSKNTSSGVAPIFVDRDGENRIFIIKGANQDLKPDDIDKAAETLKECNLIILQLEVPLETVYYAIDFGNRNDIEVILNPAPANSLDFEMVKKVDIFVPNETELADISNMKVNSLEDVKQAVNKLQYKGLKNIIVTLGSKGAFVATEKDQLLVESIDISPHDTTGAGDAFIGSLAFYYLQKKSLVEAVKYASIYAGLSTLKPGTQKSYLSSEEFEKRLPNYLS